MPEMFLPEGIQEVKGGCVDEAPGHYRCHTLLDNNMATRSSSLSVHMEHKGKRIEIVSLPLIGSVEIEITVFYCTLFIGLGLSYFLLVLSMIDLNL